jgi:flagellar hook-associated protein 3 FlgL
MSFISIGDQSRLFLNQRQNFQLKTEMQRLTQELASGRLVRPATKTTGDMAHLLGLERAQTRLTANRTAVAEAQHFVDTMQAALGVAHDLAAGLGPALLVAASTGQSALLTSTAADAAGKFATSVSALNARAADRAVLSGTATGTSPLADPAMMLAALRTATAAETTAAGIEAIVDDWFFGAGGGFETLGYQGATAGEVRFRIGATEEVAVAARADDDTIRGFLKGIAMAALIDSAGIAGNAAEQAGLAELAGEGLVNASAGLAGMRAELGADQARIEQATVRQSAEKAALDLAEAQFTEADPFDTATALQQVQTQLETLYTLTARTSQLTLAAFLR